MAPVSAPQQGLASGEEGRLRARIEELERELAAARGNARLPWRHLEAIVDLAPQAIYLKDARFTYLLVNREYERLSMRPRTETLGRDDFQIFEEPVARLFRSQDEEVVSCGAAREFKETIPLPGGTRTFITSKFPLRSEAGELLGVAGMCADITELESARDRLEQAQAELVKKARLATLGELAAVVAHEVRNPLGVIFNSVAGLRRGPASADPSSRELLDIVSVEAGRLNRIVGALLELARPSRASFAPADPARLARAAIEAARALAESTEEVRLELPAALPKVRVDEHLLRQALGNLVCNALQAPGRRGPVVVTVELDAPATRLRLAVRDDGEGVPAELRERIFAPFFTTRATGTGLGLAVVRHVAEAHGGAVTLQPAPGGGVTFELQIPLGVE